MNDHYWHGHEMPWFGAGSPKGLDFRDDENLVTDQNGTYSAFSHTRRVIDIIRNSTADQPFFIDLSYQLPHFPLQVPDHYLDMYGHDDLPDGRKIYLAMVSVLDESIGRVVQALRDVGQLDNTVIVFTTDNGGEVQFGGNNYPLRGQKYGLFEGGTRGVAFVKLPREQNGRDYPHLFHAVDWFATLQSMAGVAPVPGSDSRDHWPFVASHPPRSEFVYNIRPQGSAIRKGDYKLIVGDPDPLTNAYGWYTESGLTYSETNSDIIFCSPCPNYNHTIWLFDISRDESERVNLVHDRPDVVVNMLELLLHHARDYQPSLIGKFLQTGSGDPKYWGGAWTPGWCRAV